MDRPADPIERPAQAVATPARAPAHVRPAEPAESAFEDLFEREHAQLYRAMYLITGSPQESEELMQDAFLRVWERWDRVRDMENPAAYLCRVAVNGARSRGRRMALAAKRTLALTPTGDPFEAADLRDELLRALKTLTARQRIALVLTDFLDLSSEEAAEMLGVTAGTVRALASHGRSALRIKIGADDA